MIKKWEKGGEGSYCKTKIEKKREREERRRKDRLERQKIEWSTKRE